MKVARSSPSRSWAACIVTIAEVPECYQRRGICKGLHSIPPCVHHPVVAGHVWRFWTKQGTWMLSGAGSSGCKNTILLTLLTSCDFQGSHDNVIDELNLYCSRWLSEVASTGDVASGKCVKHIPTRRDVALRFSLLTPGQNLIDPVLKIGQPFNAAPLVLPCRMAQRMHHLRLHRH